MDSLLQQVTTLAAVVVGAVSTYLATSANERAKYHRDHGHRWDDRRLQAYVDYGNALKRLSGLATRVAAGRGLPHDADPLQADAAQPDLGTAEAERAVRWESVLLLGSPEAVAAARAWHEAVWRIVWFARGKLTDANAWESAVRDTDRTRDAYYLHARKDLGVKSGTLPPPTWPPSWVPSTKHDSGEDHPSVAGHPGATQRNPHSPGIAD